MKRSAIKKGLVTAFTAVMLLWSASAARAAFEVRFTSGNVTSTVVDNGAGDTNSAVGVIGINSKTVGSFTISGTASQSNSPGTNTLGSLNLTLSNVKRVNNNNLNDLTVEASATNYNQPSPPVNLTSGLTAGVFRPVVSGDQYTVNSYLDTGNNLFGESGAGVTGTPTQTEQSDGTVTPGATTEVDGINYSSQYSLTVKTVYHLSNGVNIGTSGGEADVTATVPAPGAVILCASAAPFLGFFGWKRRRQKVA